MEKKHQTPKQDNQNWRQKYEITWKRKKVFTIFSNIAFFASCKCEDLYSGTSFQMYNKTLDSEQNPGKTLNHMKNTSKRWKTRWNEKTLGVAPVTMTKYAHTGVTKNGGKISRAWQGHTSHAQLIMGIGLLVLVTLGKGRLILQQTQTLSTLQFVRTHH